MLASWAGCSSLLGHSPFPELPPPSPAALKSPSPPGQSSQLSCTWRSPHPCSCTFSGAHRLNWLHLDFLPTFPAFFSVVVLFHHPATPARFSQGVSGPLLHSAGAQCLIC